MGTKGFLSAVFLALWASFSLGQDLQDLKLNIPEGWALHQDALGNGTIILGFANGSEYITFYAKKGGNFDLMSLFTSEAKVVESVTSEQVGPLKWNFVTTSKETQGLGTSFVRAFSAEHNGHIYFGYSRSNNASAAQANTNLFLRNIIARVETGASSRSLTGNDYTGKKYYFGWGAAGGGDPSMMHNEVKYDVKHTHDVFTKDIGGSYLGEQMVGSGTVNGTKIRNEWARLKGLLQPTDMYLQYSSGHGSPSGLAVGVSYNEIRDNALSYKAKEIVIFIMACHSGGLVESFNAKKAEWENWQAQGRTLYVMSSSTKAQSSSTGPGTHPGEPGGPTGSAGSAFGHALWRALAGEADGYVDSVKDGFLTLGEIRDYTTWKTKKVGNHTPVTTGAYNANLVMSKVPSREFLARLAMEGGTDGMSDEEVMEAIQELDESMRL